MGSNPQTAAWVGADADGTYLVRQYADGAMTAERKLGDRYTGEVTLEPELLPRRDAPPKPMNLPECECMLSRVHEAHEWASLSHTWWCPGVAVSS
jgi:hypothetical protein